LAKRSLSSLTELRLQALITSDLLQNAFPVLSQLSSILQFGTATMKRSFSVMARVWTRLRQRLPAEHSNDFMAISVERPDTLSRYD